MVAPLILPYNPVEFTSMGILSSNGLQVGKWGYTEVTMAYTNKYTNVKPMQK